VTSINFITKIDLTITIGVHSHNDIVGDINNISTIPSTITFSTNLGFTIKETIIWAVSVSPFIFNNNNTHVDFTGIDSTVVVKVTIGH
jgi:hypothetical protein